MFKNTIKGAVILIVDDNPINLSVLYNYLISYNLTVLVSQSGQRALQQALDNKPDCILLDIMMPGMDGFEVCRLLKENPATCDIPIIFMSALTDTINKVKGFELGAVDYVTKPFQHEVVYARLVTHVTLRRQKAELAELNASKDRFFSIIAHDLRTPLNALIGLSEMLLEYIDSLDGAKLKEYLTMLSNAGNNMNRLLENLLQWSRLQINSMQIQKNKFRLHELFAEIISLFAENARQKNISFRNNIAVDLEVFADKNMLNTVFRNLLSNALKFSYQNGVIEIFAAKSKNTIDVRIQDYGVGIKPEVLKKLFRIEEKTVTSGTAGEKGTGLGLILCKEFVEKNNGKLRVESEVAKGTTFICTFPTEE